MRMRKQLKHTLALYGSKYLKSMGKLQKDHDILLKFYNFPAEHWQHIRTSIQIESTLATVRLRKSKSRNCGSRDKVLAMIF